MPRARQCQTPRWRKAPVPAHGALRRSKNRDRIVETVFVQNHFDVMEGKPSSELVDQAERELDETKVLVQQQFGIVNRLKRLGADCKDAILLLINLLELHEARERRLAQLRLKLRRER
jgi:hypothetical protein